MSESFTDFWQANISVISLITTQEHCSEYAQHHYDNINDGSNTSTESYLCFWVASSHVGSRQTSVESDSVHFDWNAEFSMRTPGLGLGTRTQGLGLGLWASDSDSDARDSVSDWLDSTPPLLDSTVQSLAVFTLSSAIAGFPHLPCWPRREIIVCYFGVLLDFISF